jgi:hypothetical protein
VIALQTAGGVGGEGGVREVALLPLVGGEIVVRSHRAPARSRSSCGDDAGVRRARRGWSRTAVVEVARELDAVRLAVDGDLGDDRHRATNVLTDLREWMSRHNGAIMAVLLLVIGAKLLRDGLSGL